MTNRDTLLALRKRSGLTQKQFAEIAGCHKHEVSRWETGRVQLRDSKLERFCDKIEEYLLGANR